MCIRDRPLKENQAVKLIATVPEGIPKTKIEITNLDGQYSEYVIAYNGQTGENMLVKQDVVEE